MSIEVGSKVTGKVSGITNFGAFIDLGEHKNGLVHISEISDGFVKDIHDVLSVGDEVTVKVLSISDDGKIALSIRKAKESHQNQDHQGHSHSEHGPKSRPRNNGGKSFNDRSNNHNNNKKRSYSSHKNEPHKKDDFDSLLAGFMKQSDERLTSLKRNTEGKRGGRGGRRS
ncbi:RNA-binding protein S1 [Ligilactobacillus pobuzihii]|uniref:S1 domain-containing RNA-binding protein n=1 Tax=Ligilactobacillus pobuzihii TaxID=449659 RepID=UPI0019D19E92|nr:S1 domain-containing RNA-binding protein [Ligilactobacillus pobuzihii]MBN7273700.1 RNA-binding protein S1 [Ligilactobacillus pobuzihii]